VSGRRLLALGVTLAALIAALVVLRPIVDGAAFVVRAADMHGFARTLAEVGVHAPREREIAIPTTRGPLRARIYEPGRTARRAALLTSGLHASGIDEPRLVRLARDLSGDGLVIVTPDIPELSRFAITPAITDTIERAGAWLATESGLAPDGRVGLMGISFSGGLSIVAAGRPSLAGHVSSVFALGGHDDLLRVLRYLCTGQEPYPRQQVPVRLKPDPTDDTRSGRLQPGDVFTRAPHDYGVAVILLGIAERLVPPAQVEPLREGVRKYLRASALDGGVDKARAPAEFEAVRAQIRMLPEPSATLLRHVVNRDVVHLGPRLLPYISLYGGDAALSVSRSPKPSAPVFLLHGEGDNLIPPIESEYLADDLRGHTRVRLLISGLISHADADQPGGVGDVMDLASFWGDLLRR
jgi:dienelactone hydrolase